MHALSSFAGTKPTALSWNRNCPPPLCHLCYLQPSADKTQPLLSIHACPMPGLFPQHWKRRWSLSQYEELLWEQSLSLLPPVAVSLVESHRSKRQPCCALSSLLAWISASPLQKECWCLLITFHFADKHRLKAAPIICPGKSKQMCVWKPR